MAEIVAAALAVWAVVVVPGWLVWPTGLLGLTLLALALMDFHHFILADILVLPLLVFGILISFSISTDAGTASVIGSLIGGGSAFALRKIYRLTRGRDGLGLGDVKLLATAGAWVSWQGLPSVVFIASVSGLAAWLALWAFKSRTQFKLSATQRVPFGIFLALGLWIVWLHGPINFGIG
jgi:leader peptidase (prepilin peptidase)/N-methyltransferase